MKSCVFDLETSALEAVGAGTLLCAVVKPLDSRRYKVLRADNYKDKLGHEKGLLVDILETLGEFDLWIGHNVIGFDYPWLASRCIQLGAPLPPHPFMYDTMLAFGRLKYKTVPNLKGRPSKGLDHVVDFFGIKQKKTRILPNHHWETIWGNTGERMAAMDDLVAHCVGDVLMTESVYRALLPVDMRAIIKRVL